MFVRPALGLKVRDPISLLLLPDEGKEVAESSHWYRRIADGDVVVVPVNPVQIHDSSEPTKE